MRLVAVASVAAALALTGCGGSDGLSEEETERLRSVEEALSTLEVGPGLGEASPPPALTTGWETDFSRRAVPLSEIQSGGPGKDGIPALDEPRFAPAGEIEYLEAREPVLVLELGPEARAYPIQILVWHELVNDTVDGTPVLVTFCPLCNTAIVFDRRLDGRTLDFGTTGNLRSSDLVMYDRQTESWWQQFGGRAIVGELTGRRLDQLPARIMAWSAFERLHPDGEVLTRDTGHTRRYGENPYPGYDDVDSSPLFPTANADDDRLSPKERVIFVERGGEAVAVPLSLLRNRGELELEVGGSSLVVRWRRGVASPLDDGRVASGRDIGAVEVREDGELVPFDEPFWFAVAAFRPDVRVVGARP